MAQEHDCGESGQGSLGGVLPPSSVAPGNGPSKGGFEAAGQPAVEDLPGEGHAPESRSTSVVHHFRGSLDRDAGGREATVTDRRTFLGLGVGAVAAAAVMVAPAVASAARPSQLPPKKPPLNPCHYRIPWILEPFARTGVEGCSPDDVGTSATPCAACAACHAHAANKIFASQAAANAGRAHKGCRCSVVKGTPMLVSTWNTLFSQGLRRRTSVDKRWPWVAQALMRDPSYR